MNVDSAIESAAKEHVALVTAPAANKDEQARAFSALKATLETLTRDVEQIAFQGERSKRKQWAEVQKEISDLLKEARGVLEAEEAEPVAAEKVERRYQRMQARIARLAGG